MVWVRKRAGAVSRRAPRARRPARAPRTWAGGCSRRTSRRCPRIRLPTSAVNQLQKCVILHKVLKLNMGSNHSSNKQLSD